jgi:nitroreductase
MDADGAGLYDLHGQPLPATGTRPADVLQQALHNPALRWNMAAFKLAVLFCVQPGSARQHHGEGALRQLHLAAGAAAQDLSLAAAALGLFARPMRMLKEQVLEQGLGLPGLPIYQVLCGLNRSTNLSSELL